MTNKVVLYYTNDTSYTLRNVTVIDDLLDLIRVYSNTSRKISNVVSETLHTTTTIKKSDLLGYSAVEGNKITNIKLSDRFSTLVFTQS